MLGPTANLVDGDTVGEEEIRSIATAVPGRISNSHVL